LYTDNYQSLISDGKLFNVKLRLTSDYKRFPEMYSTLYTLIVVFLMPEIQAMGICEHGNKAFSSRKDGKLSKN
jgi:hypothetical protein